MDLQRFQGKYCAPQGRTPTGLERFCYVYRNSSVTSKQQILKDGISGYGKLPRTWKTVKKRMVKPLHDAIVSQEGFCMVCDAALKPGKMYCCGKLAGEYVTFKGERKFKSRGHDNIFNTTQLLRYRSVHLCKTFGEGGGG